ncbi:MAG TPA: hypothetical protein PLZ51_11520, partial [Aggregatilineales bacterium]|nr:hypothetical protein [Aggregatilineales bacterium]
TYRTLPGTDHAMAAYFARGTGHNDMAAYSERSDDWLKNMHRLHKKYQTVREMLPKPISDIDPSKKVGIISFGTNDPAIEEARDMLEKQGISTNYMRVRALPLAKEVTDFINTHDRIYIPENNFDGQLFQIICLDHPQDLTHIKSLPLGDGLPMTAQWLFNKIMSVEKK